MIALPKWLLVKPWNAIKWFHQAISRKIITKLNIYNWPYTENGDPLKEILWQKYSSRDTLAKIQQQRALFISNGLRDVNSSKRRCCRRFMKKKVNTLWQSKEGSAAEKNASHWKTVTIKFTNCNFWTISLPESFRPLGKSLKL